MSGRCPAALLLIGIAGTVHAEECSPLQPESAAYETAKSAMSGHFPVELENIQNCGVHGFSELFTATVDTYQTHEGWAKSGELRCWRLSQHEPGEPYSCGRKIISRHNPSSRELVSEFDIPLPTINDATFALSQTLVEGDEIESMDYVPVPCGGAWSISKHGFLLKLKPQEPRVRRQFLAKKNCSPTPCLWEIEELEPEWWVH